MCLWPPPSFKACFGTQIPKLWAPDSKHPPSKTHRFEKTPHESMRAKFEDRSLVESLGCSFKGLKASSLGLGARHAKLRILRFLSDTRASEDVVRGML